MPSSLTSIAESFPFSLVDYTASLAKLEPLLTAGWEIALRDYPNKQYKATILAIIKFGVKIGYIGPKQLILSQNLPTANEASDVLTKDLETQIAHD